MQVDMKNYCYSMALDLLAKADITLDTHQYGEIAEALREQAKGEFPHIAEAVTCLADMFDALDRGNK